MGLARGTENGCQRLVRLSGPDEEGRGGGLNGGQSRHETWPMADFPIIELTLIEWEE